MAQLESFITRPVGPKSGPHAAMERSNERTCVGARAVFEAPETPTMSRGNGADAKSGEPVAESQYPSAQYAPQQLPGYPSAAVATRGSAPGAGGVELGVIWEGTTWDSFPFLCSCCAPVCCQARGWKITQDTIEMKSGCCGYQQDTLYTSRIKDLSYSSNCCKDVCCCGRGTVIIHSADVSHPELHLTTFGAKDIYKSLQGLQRANRHQQHVVMS